MPDVDTARHCGGGGIDELIERLAGYAPARGFNQYCQAHPDLDRPDAAEARVRNLRRYLICFTGARFVLVGEAAGYAGCRFSGIPFTSEAQIAGPQPLAWARGLEMEATSRRPGPWDERSATIVWGALGDRRDCLLWNAFPWHPCDPACPLANRAPGREVQAGAGVLRAVLALFAGAQPVAVGRVAQQALAAIGVCAPYVRHPSHGGRHAFEAGLAALTKNT